MRALFKCSECRRKKIKCTPPDRDYNNTGQKCDFCKKRRETPCGPNYRASEDPGVARNNVRLDADNQRQGIPSEQQRTSPMLTKSQTDTDNETSHLIQTEGAKLPEDIVDPPSDSRISEIVRTAEKQLEKLNSLGRCSEHASYLPRISCRSEEQLYDQLSKTQTSFIDMKFRAVFTEVCKLGQLLHHQKSDVHAQPVFLKLALALRRWPKIFDGTCTGALREIATFFLDTRDLDEYYFVLAEASNIVAASTRPDDACGALAEVLPEIARKTSEILKSQLKDGMILNEVRFPPSIPVGQLSAQHRNPNVPVIIAKNSDNLKTQPLAFLNLETVHIAARLGHDAHLTTYLDAGTPVDTQDFLGHTALFYAAVNGHNKCCQILLKRRAHPDMRNHHGTSILEAATMKGRLSVVKQLVQAGAEINPIFKCCSSSPLQAAIESPNFRLDIVLYLLDHGASVDAQRLDCKNALDLARERGYDDLEDHMYRRQGAQDAGLDYFQPSSLRATHGPWAFRMPFQSVEAPLDEQ